jgi:hypothetical protein
MISKILFPSSPFYPQRDLNLRRRYRCFKPRISPYEIGFLIYRFSTGRTPVYHIFTRKLKKLLMALSMEDMLLLALNLDHLFMVQEVDVAEGTVGVEEGGGLTGGNCL